MNMGFVIDNSACIGCHACSTACKSENEVPLGVHRTWVKTVDSGQYPDNTRSFQVTRCNHCANPPCAHICPTQAMYQRADGVVEFDSNACIGCKACMQACPYDAIYLDPATHTAAKCHFCAHRLDVGLEPACVVVCPEHAIISGDLDDPESEASRILARNSTSVRKPEQGTAPKLFYIEGNELVMNPDIAGANPDFMYSDVLVGDHGPSTADSAPVGHVPDAHHTHTPLDSGLSLGGPLKRGSRMTDHMVQVSWNAQHQNPWHWPIPTYIVTKHIAGGTFAFLAACALTPLASFEPVMMVTGGALALLMTAITLALLIYDLGRPDRFFYLLTRPNWKSWVARAAWLLTAFSIVATSWWLLEVAGWYTGGSTLVTQARWPLALLTFPLAIASAIYTAFLFAQARGRAFWQGSHLPFQMGIHAVMLGTAPIVFLDAVFGGAPEVAAVAHTGFLISTIASVAITLWSDHYASRSSESARRTATEITRGRWRGHFWGGGILAGHILPIALLCTGNASMGAAAFLSASLGLFLYSYAFVMAPQEIPNS